MKTHSYNQDAVSIYELMSREECESCIARAEHVGFEPAPVHSSQGDVRNASVRNNERVIFDDPSFAELFWKRMKGTVPPLIGKWRACGLNERFRVYRYEKYQQFRKHSDGSFRRSETEESRLTFMVYLNQEFQGGFTDFGAFKVWPETGMGLWFKHGLTHEGAMVLDGVKYALRSDVMYRADQTEVPL